MMQLNCSLWPSSSSLTAKLKARCSNWLHCILSAQSSALFFTRSSRPIVSCSILLQHAKRCKATGSQCDNAKSPSTEPKNWSKNSSCKLWPFFSLARCLGGEVDKPRKDKQQLAMARPTSALAIQAMGLPIVRPRANTCVAISIPSIHWSCITKPYIFWSRQ